MNHQFFGAAVVALLLGGAGSALAYPREASYAWAPASGPVAGYAVYASIGGNAEELVGAVPEPSASIEVESGVYVTVRVAAYDAAGRFGPLSEAASLVRLCPGDFDGDEVTGYDDVTDARSCFGATVEGFCAGADVDLDGTIEFTDIQALSVGANACALVAAPEPTICLGDLDGDGAIGYSDYHDARACLGKLAQGACAAADVDGDGIVSSTDVHSVRRAIDANACAN